MTGEWRFWAITAGYFLSVIATNGTLANVVAILTDRGVPSGRAVATLSAAGLAMVVGRLSCGWCLDRFSGPYVAVCFQIIPALGLTLLAYGGTSTSALAGAALCGLGLGAHVGLLAFFASRYFGLRAYGKIYGTMFGLFLIGNGLGPLLGNLSHDVWQSYDPALWAFAIALVAVAVLFAPLGPYRYLPQKSGRGSATVRNEPSLPMWRQSKHADLVPRARAYQISVPGEAACRD
jgi:MFS family permease